MPDSKKLDDPVLEHAGGFTRRGFLKGAGISAVAAAVADTGLARLAEGAGGAGCRGPQYAHLRVRENLAQS